HRLLAWRAERRAHRGRAVCEVARRHGRDRLVARERAGGVTLALERRGAVRTRRLRHRQLRRAGGRAGGRRQARESGGRFDGGRGVGGHGARGGDRSAAHRAWPRPDDVRVAERGGRGGLAQPSRLRRLRPGMVRAGAGPGGAVTEASAAAALPARPLTRIAHAAILVFGIVMALVGAVVPVISQRIALDLGTIGTLFLAMNGAMLVASLTLGMVVDRLGL